MPGLQVISGQGEFTLARHPEFAHFASRPRNAIAAGVCNVTATPVEFPQRIPNFVALRRQKAAPLVDNRVDATRSLANILNLLREHRKYDLTLYKPSALKRRSAQCLGVHGLTSLAGDEGFIRDNPQEQELLFKEMLIGVTSFFSGTRKRGTHYGRLYWPSCCPGAHRTCSCGPGS